MSKGNIKFSQKALDSTNNQNSNKNTLSSVKSSWTWILLCSITLLFSGTIFWGFFGSMNESVSGVGITMLSNGSRPVIANANGTISHLNINIGSRVESEQILGQIFNAENFFSLEKLESEYDILKAQIEILRSGINDVTKKHLDASEEKSKHLIQLSLEREKAKNRYSEISRIYLDLLEQGAESKLSYYQSLSQELEGEVAMVSATLDHLTNDINMHDDLWEQRQKLLSLEQELGAKEEELALAHKLYSDSYWVRSSFKGRVRERFKENGAYVQVGEKIALIDSDKEDGIYLLAYISTSEGKKIKNGMDAFFSPMALPSSEFGFMRCIVRDVSSLPVNLDSIQSELMNASLTEMLSGNAAMVRVLLELIPDSKSNSKFSWTTNSSIPIEITNGMLGQVFINTEHRMPVSYIVPSLRKILSGDNIANKNGQK